MLTCSIIQSASRNFMVGVGSRGKEASHENPSSKYTLYLGYNEEVDNYYPIGLLYGKIPNDVQEDTFYGEVQDKQVLDMVDELKKLDK